MSFHCEECHVVATGKTLDQALHFLGSYGRCESCGYGDLCGDCRCPGDWAKAAKEVPPIVRARLAVGVPGTEQP